MSAGRWLCPWPTLVVIPTTLAPETGKVSWVSMGLRRVLFLAEVDTRPSKSQDPPSVSEVIASESKPRRSVGHLGMCRLQDQTGSGMPRSR
jgi:hypothetical protein